MKIGILKESRVPPDKRVPLSPLQCKEVFAHFPKIKIIVQPSANRCFMDEQYEEEGLLLDDNLSDCDLLMGIKETKPETLLPGKTYLFFSHTVKKQPYNKDLLKAVLDKKITLIDYELLKDNQGNRLVGFGKWAGIVGAYNGIRAFFIKNRMKEPKPAHTCKNYKDFRKTLDKLELPPVKILVTGTGRVAGGAAELLDSVGCERVDEHVFLSGKEFKKPVYTQVDVDAYNEHIDGRDFNMQHFFDFPNEYKSNFYRFTRHADILIMSAFWHLNAPKLITKEDLRKDDFNIKVIADITCDMDGAIASTLRASTIEDPFYGYNPKTGQEELAFISPDNVCVIAVDNLPNELPKDASKEFGAELISKVLPELILGDESSIIKNATIVKNGVITEPFAYLKEWATS